VNTGGHIERDAESRARRDGIGHVGCDARS
jgi:hypothetical protein